MTVALIYNRRPGTTGSYIERALRQLAIPYEHWAPEALPRIRRGYDFYLRVDHGDDYDISVPAFAHPFALYAIDTHLPHSWRKIRRLARACDVVYCAQLEAAASLPRAVWVTFGCDPAVHHGPALGKRWDLGFVGTDGGVPRKFLLQILRERHPNSSLGSAPFERMSEIYSQSRIGVNYAIAGEINMRVFEVMASGTLLVTSALRGPGFERLGLRDGEHFRVYHSPSELLRLIEDALADDAERERIARQGMQAVLGSHTYAHRIRQMMEDAARRFGRPALAVASA